MSQLVELHDVAKRFEELLRHANAGEEVIVTEAGAPKARIVPMGAATGPRKPGLHRGAASMSEDFDAPLPAAFWNGL